MPRRLKVWRTWWVSYVYVFAKLGTFTRAAIVPFIISIFIFQFSVLGEMWLSRGGLLSGTKSEVLSALKVMFALSEYLIVVALIPFAVSCHRIVLQGISKPPFFRYSKVEVYYLLAWALYALLDRIRWIVEQMTALDWLLTLSSGIEFVVQMVALSGAVYFPAIATQERGVSVYGIFRAMKGNRFRLVLVAFLIALPLVLFAKAVGHFDSFLVATLNDEMRSFELYLLSLSSFFNTSNVGLIPVWTVLIPSTSIVILVGFVWVAVWMVVLSLTFHGLSSVPSKTNEQT